MLMFPRHFSDIFEYKRPRYPSGMFDRDFDDDDDYCSPFMNYQPPQEMKQPRRVPVPVHHEPGFQHQQQRQYQPQHMPVPQPTGSSYYPTTPSHPSSDERESVRSPIQIPVRHVALTPPRYSETERIIPVCTEHAPKQEETSKMDLDEGVLEADEKLQGVDEKPKRPPVRKQTSLVVSDDHTTPIPMPSSLLEHGEMVIEEEMPGTPAKQRPLRKQTSLIVAEDRDTPIPMPYESLKNKEPLLEEDEAVDLSPTATESEGVEDLDTPVTVPPIKIEKSAESPKVAPEVGYKTSSASVTLSPRSPRRQMSRPFSPEAREIPITVRGSTGQPLQSKGSGTSVSNGANKRMPMPQPQPTGEESANKAASSESFTKPEDSYTQPKPPAPKPKEEWVDPRIKAALDTIEKINDEALGLGGQVDSLEVVSKDRTYLAIEEQLTKLLLKLDCIDSFGDDRVRTKRKACIRQVQQTLDALELKLVGS